MDSLLSLLIGDLEVLPEIVVTVRMVIVMFALEVFASIVHILGGMGRR